MMRRAATVEGKVMAYTAGIPASAGKAKAARPAWALLLAGVSTGAAALACVVAPSQARAQAVNGTPTVQFGSDPASRFAGNDVFNVTADEALVDWAVTDPNVFLPTGNTLAFQRDVATPYTVLNRVASAPAGTAGLQINGTVSSDTYGKIWFYNPGGWIVGSTGVFNVGGLVLTSSPITVDPDTDLVSRLYGDKGEIRLGASSAAGFVDVQAGAAINALGSGSYVALVAPRVTQGGTVTADGSVAYVGADAATLSINNGIFDIVVDTGTSDANGVVHTGTTTGSAGDTVNPNRQTYLVAVPKNNALTMLVSGNLGYAAANTAIGETDGTIVLSAGYNVVGGAANIASGGVPGTSVVLTALAASNDIAVAATDAITVDVTASNTDLAANARLAAVNAVTIDVGNRRRFNVGGNLDVSATDGVKGGTVNITAANNGIFAVAGNLDVGVDGNGGVQTDPQTGALLPGSVGADGVGGNITVSVTDGLFGVGGNANLHSIATSGIGELSAGTATAGNVSFTQSGAASNVLLGALNPDASLTMVSQALAPPVASQAAPATGSASTSGAVTLSVSGGQFASLGMSLGSYADGTPGLDNAAQNAAAGSVSVSFGAGAAPFSAGSVGAAVGAYAPGGGTASVGNVGVTLDGAALALTGAGNLSLSAFTSGTVATPASLSLALTNGANLTMPGSVSLSSYASAPGSGAATPADILLSVDQSSLTAFGVYAYSSAYGSASAGDARGGAIDFAITNGGSLSTTFDLYASSDGYGGDGINGGSGTGGDITLTLGAGTLSVGTSVGLFSHGYAGARSDAAGQSGIGTGGAVSVTINNADAVLTTPDFTASSAGSGAQFGDSQFSGSQVGDGANGQGGKVGVTLGAGTVTTGSLTLRADGDGGGAINAAGFAPAKGGEGIGGTADLAVTGGTLNGGTLALRASGYGGKGADFSSVLGINGGMGGIGRGGAVSASLTGGTVNADAVTLDADGNRSIPNEGPTTYFGVGGGVVFEDGVAGGGGAGYGGSALLTINGGALLDAADALSRSLSVAVGAIGEGGAGGPAYTEGGSFIADSGSGGNGFGGSATIDFVVGTFDAQQITANASGLGGLGGNDLVGGINDVVNVAGSGGSGTGGTALLTIASDFSALTSASLLRSIAVRADGTGARGGGAAIAGNGGNGSGGSAGVAVTGGVVSLSGPVLSAVGTGGAGGSASGAFGGGAGGSGLGGSVSLSASGQTTSLDVTGYALLASGSGGAGGNGGQSNADLAGNGGAGGAGAGGSVTIRASDLASASIDGLANVAQFDVGGSGGAGGNGGTAAFFGLSATGNGGEGGNGSAGALLGQADSGAVLAFSNVDFTANGTGGAGGARAFGESSLPPSASVGGIGGIGSGGTIRLVSTGTGSSLTSGGFSASASGAGGAGVAGYGYDAVTGAGAAGSAAGEGKGGTIALLADAGGAMVLAADSNVGLTANGTGGSGGAGGAGLSGTGGDGGAGGLGGHGAGGTISVTANNLGTLSLAQPGAATLVANGFGGQGGSGGIGADNVAPTSIGGDGGDAGVSHAGDGGIIALSAAGGTLGLGDISASATGTTNFANTFAQPGAGTAGSGNFGLSGYFTSTGGEVTVLSGADAQGRAGSLVAGATSIDVTSVIAYPNVSFLTFAGLATITDSSDLATGGMRFGSLNVNASGSGGAFGTIAVSSVLNPIEVDTNLTLSASGAISLDLAGTGGVRVGAAAALSSDSAIAITGTAGGQLDATDITLNSFGTITIGSVACAVATCSPARASNTFNAFSNGDFALNGPARVAGLGSVFVYSGSSITGETGSGYVSGGSIDIGGAGDVTVRNASGGAITVDAGAVADGSFFYYPGLLTLGEDAGGGAFDGTGQLTFRSGGDIRVTSGNTLATDAGIAFASGNNIVVGTDNAISANRTVSSVPFDITFAAGGLAVEYTLGAGDITSLVIGSGASVAAGTGGVRLSGQAIDTRGASFSGAFFTADIFGTLALGDVQQDDGGLLGSGCLEGDICLGAVSVDGAIGIGQGNARPLHVSGTGALSGQTVSIAAQGTITYGQAATALTIAATGGIDLSSSLGDINLLSGAQLTAARVALSAGGSLLGGGGITANGDDIGLTFGGDINAASLTAARQLTSYALVGGAAEPTFSNGGAFSVGALTLGANASLDVTGDLTVGTLAMGGFDAALRSGGTVSLTGTSGVRNLALTGGGIAFGDIAGTGNLALTATGTITGTSANFGGTLDATAQNLTVTDLAAGGDLTLTIVNVAALGMVMSGGAVNIDPVSLTFDTITSVGATSLAGGTITGGTVTAGTGITITASDALTLSAANAGTAMALTVGGAADIGSLAAGDQLDLSAASLDLGSSRSGLDTIISVIGSANIGSATAGLASITRSTANVVVEALGNSYVGGSLVTVFDVVQGQTFSVASSTSDLWSAGALPRFSDGNGLIATLFATSSDDSGLPVGTQIGANFGLLQLGNLAAPFGALVGEVAGTRFLIGANGEITAPATGTLRVGYWDSNAGDNTGSIAFTFGGPIIGSTPARPANLTITTGSDLTLGSAEATQAINLAAGRALTFATIDAGGSVGLGAPSITGTSITAGQDITISTDTNLTIDLLDAGGDITLLADAGAIDIADIAAGGLVTADADAVRLAASGSLRAGRITADVGNIRIAALGDVDLRGTVDAVTALSVTAGGLIGVGALATGSSIDFTSADLVLGATAALGESTRTTSISLANTGQAPMLLGGGLTATGGYAISNAEFARIRSSGNLGLEAGSGLQVGTLDIAAQVGTTGGQVGENGALNIDTSGLASLVGAITFSNAGGNTFALNAGMGVFLDAATGSLRLVEGNTRGGTLRITGQGLAAMTSKALGDIANLTDTALITARLSLNDGVTADRTLIEAGSVSITADRDIYIQNTSAGTRFGDRRGLVADTLTLSGRQGGAALDIVINGQVGGVSGLDVIPKVSINGSFTGQSSINGCVIVRANACNKPPFDPVEVRDVIVEVLGKNPQDGALPVLDLFTRTTLMQLNQIAPAGFEPLIDEPVTGTGNDDLLGSEDGEGE